MYILRTYVRVQIINVKYAFKIIYENINIQSREKTLSRRSVLLKLARAARMKFLKIFYCRTLKLKTLKIPIEFLNIFFWGGTPKCMDGPPMALTKQHNEKKENR